MEDVPDDFFQPAFDDSEFGGIDVPGCWQPQGYDKYHYVGAQGIIPYDIPKVPQNNPCGAYRTEFIYEPDAALPVTELVFEVLTRVFMSGSMENLSATARFHMQFLCSISGSIWFPDGIPLQF